MVCVFLCVSVCALSYVVCTRENECIYCHVDLRRTIDSLLSRSRDKDKEWEIKMKREWEMRKQEVGEQQKRQKKQNI